MHWNVKDFRQHFPFFNNNEQIVYLDNAATTQKNIETIKSVLVPFYRGAVVFILKTKKGIKLWTVLVPFYRGAVVFVKGVRVLIDANNEFSSPFIEERLYFQHNQLNK